MYIVHCFHTLKSAGEMKTKPTQHSKLELRGLGYSTRMVRAEYEMTQDLKDKIALFCDINKERYRM